MYNHDLLLCPPTYFTIAYSINPYMRTDVQPDPTLLAAEYAAIVAAHQAAGRTIHFLTPDPAQPDMTFTANQALIRGKRAVLGNLPPQRAGETLFLKPWLEAAGYEVIECPYRFSGQGDALPTGTGAVLKGRQWRSDPRSDAFIHDALGYDIIPIRTISDAWYDDDLVFGIIRPGLIAVAWDALDATSVKLLRARTDLEFIDVSLTEAKNFVCNLVSDGTTVVMPEGGPQLATELTRRGLTVVERPITQLKLGGGGIRCTTLALDAR
ncbi:MAG TPA: amidinotransferase [Candidatus Saccharimonadia bacterium]|nr:amidinotransferase [Candidatus Saccharimonadia bacterium]